jgi:SWI/SNF-related matrix-associated actin-dependent regulator of chromatin subfamily A-like protein 1
MTSLYRPELEEPFPFQITAAKWMASKQSCFLADEMRVGKTPAAIRACDLVGASNILVICPANARINWGREFQRFSPLDRPTQVVMPGEKPRIFGTVIVSYETSVMYADILKSVWWDVLLPDEAHRCKERSSQRTKALYGANKRSPGIIASAARIWRLSGSPCPKDVSELWTHLHSAGLAPESYWDFTFHFTTGFETTYGYQITGTKNVDELKARLSGFMLRRTLAEVMPDLPPIAFEPVTVPRSEACLSPEFREHFTQLTQIDQELQAALAGASSEKQISILESTATSSATLRRYVLACKLPAIAEQLETDLDSDIDKLVIFCVHKLGVEWMAERLRKYGVVVLYGDTPVKKRQPAIDRFRNDKTCRVFIGNIQAAGEAIDLTPCSEIVYLESSWVPGENAQAAMRLRGVNQKWPVRARVFALFNSVDERVSEVLTRRTKELLKIF